MMAGSFAGFNNAAVAAEGGGRNFTVNKGEGGGEKPGHLGQASGGGGRKTMSNEQKAAAKVATLVIKIHII